MRIWSRLQHRLQNRSPLDRAAKSCLHGFEACRKRTRTSCSLRRQWSGASAGETTSCSVFRHKGLQQTSDGLAESQRRNVGHLLAAAHARAKERARLLNEQRIAEAAKRRAEDLAIRARYLDQLGRRQME